MVSLQAIDAGGSTGNVMTAVADASLGGWSNGVVHLVRMVEVMNWSFWCTMYIEVR
jgi:hypothetical protein